MTNVSTNFSLTYKIHRFFDHYNRSANQSKGKAEKPTGKPSLSSWLLGKAWHCTGQSGRGLGPTVDKGPKMSKTIQKRINKNGFFGNAQKKAKKK